MSDLSNMTTKALRKLAGELEIPGRSKLRKDALIKAIEAVQAAAEPLAEKEAAAEVAAVAAEVPEVVEEATDRHPYEDDTPLLPPLELGGIPVGYNREILSLMVQDPTTLFSYWSVASAEGDPVFESGQAEVRLYDVTGDSDLLVRSESIEPSAGRWFIHGLAPDRRFRAEFGVLVEGVFEARLVSSEAQTPPDQPSRIADEVFVSINIFETLEDKAEDLRGEVAFHLVEPDVHAGASELEHVVATRATAQTSEPIPLPLAEEPVYEGRKTRGGTIGAPSSWPLSGGVSSWALATSP